MNILITGGAGFIGSHLVDFLLKKKHKITVIDDLSTGRIENIKKFLPLIKFYRSDLSKFGKWQNSLKKIDVVFHLAAIADIVPSIQNPTKYFNANVVGTENLLRCCIKNKVKKIIYSASSSCYGIPKKYPTTENENIDPKYPYALTKRLAEEILLHYGNIYKTKVISLRLFNVYGTKSRTSGTYGAMFGVFLKQKLSGVPLTVVGDGKQKRDFTYVKDVVRAFKKTLKSKKFGVYNVGTGIPVTILHLVNLLGAKNIVRLPKRPGEPNQTFADINKIRKKLKWKPIYSFHYGIKQMKKDINLWKNAPLWTKKQILKETKNWFKFVK